MTGQISDLFEYQEKKYLVAGFSAGVAFDPTALGMCPESIQTSCWRGYQVRYGLDDKRLLMIGLGVNLVVDTIDYERIEGPTIDGVRPVDTIPDRERFNNNYLNLHYPLDYSGGLLIAAGLVEEFFDDMGFQDPWKYRELHELKFPDGRLTATIDHGSTVAEIQVIASIQNRQRDKVYARMREAKLSGQEALFEQIRDEHKANMANPAADENYDAQILERIQKAFDPGYRE